ncbi:MAG: LytTR family transcriptional regulator [Bacteroidaceae bacterium]|nr:LytTR family transcriptional regulator [Bacteroidaceae bacterium]
MPKIPNYMYGWPATVIHFLTIPFFFFDYILLFTPLGMIEMLDMDQGNAIFNISIISCILLGVLTTTRITMHFLLKSIYINYVLYGIWCLCEIFSASMLSAMFFSLYSGTIPFFNALMFIVGRMLLILSFPYTIIALSFVANGANRQHTPNEVTDRTVIKFYDHRQLMKVAIAEKYILFLKSDENYVEIHYLDNGRIMKYSLRSSMRRLENTLEAHGLVRCHRTYYINPLHVKFLGRNAQGFIYAEMEGPESIRIPVSKSYYANLATIL